MYFSIFQSGSKSQFFEGCRYLYPTPILTFYPIHLNVPCLYLRDCRYYELVDHDPALASWLPHELYTVASGLRDPDTTTPIIKFRVVDQVLSLEVALRIVSKRSHTLMSVFCPMPL